MGVISNVTLLAIILAGAAVVCEREHGTMDHPLIMPVTPFEIAMAKSLGNGAVITVTVWLSLALVVRQLLHVPIEGSIALFIVGVAIYLFFAMSVGIFLATGCWSSWWPSRSTCCLAHKRRSRACRRYCAPS